MTGQPPAPHPRMPATVIARSLLNKVKDRLSLPRTTSTLAYALAQWIEAEIGAMSADDPRLPGYTDLARRLRQPTLL